MSPSMMSMPQLADLVEKTVAKAIESLKKQEKSLRDLKELDYCEVVSEGIDQYLFGVNSRLQELQDEEEKN